MYKPEINFFFGFCKVNHITHTKKIYNQIRIPKKKEEGMNCLCHSIEKKYDVIKYLTYFRIEFQLFFLQQVIKLNLTFLKCRFSHNCTRK